MFDALDSSCSPNRMFPTLGFFALYRLPLLPQLVPHRSRITSSLNCVPCHPGNREFTHFERQLTDFVAQQIQAVVRLELAFAQSLRLVDIGQEFSCIEGFAHTLSPGQRGLVCHHAFSVPPAGPRCGHSRTGTALPSTDDHEHVKRSSSKNSTNFAGVGK